jgi:hypothetical protein
MGLLPTKRHRDVPELIEDVVSDLAHERAGTDFRGS